MKELSLLMLVAHLGLVFRGEAGSVQKNESLMRLLPPAVGGWARSPEDRSYGRENLHEYIDGGAELYLSFDLVRVEGRTYCRQGQPDIVVDIFEMGGSKDAFGVFSLQKEIADSTFGQGSQHTGGLLLFWKDRYFVSLLASPETSESRDAVVSLARAIDTAIPVRGPLPDILNLLPRRSLIPGSIRYFHHHVWLNSYYFVAAENILRLGGNTEAVLAKYADEREKMFLLIVRYEDETAARIAREEFGKHYMRDLAGKNVVMIEDGTWTGCRIERDILRIVLGAPSEDSAMRLLEENGGEEPR